MESEEIRTVAVMAPGDMGHADDERIGPRLGVAMRASGSASKDKKKLRNMM